MKHHKGKYLAQKPVVQKTTNRAKKAAIVFIILTVVLVLLAASIGIFLWYSGSVRGSMFAARSSILDTVPQPDASDSAGSEATETSAPIPADWIDKDGVAYKYRDDVISILVMGIDYMSDERHWDSKMISNGGNADVIGLVILNPKTFEFSILYIPRDTMADVIAMDADGNYIDTVRTNISAAHSYGDGKELSCELALDAVSQLLYGIQVKRYAALDYNALYTLNNIIGGLTITFTEDYTYINTAYTKGKTVTMNSEQMCRFITYRNLNDVSGAYDRGARNMAVLKALFEQCKDSIVADPTVALNMVRQLGSNLTTDLDLSEITFLARNIGKMSFDSDTIIHIPGESVMGEKYAEFYPDEQWLHDFVANTFCVRMD